MINRFKQSISRFFKRPKTGGAEKGRVIRSDNAMTQTQTSVSIPRMQRPGKGDSVPHHQQRHQKSQHKHQKSHSKKEDLLPELPELEFVPEKEGKKRFAEFALPPRVLAGLQDVKFQYCTPIQEKCLPLALQGKDITGKAQTGTGKTAAFLTAAMARLIRKPKANRRGGSCRVLVIAPTRELAIQIHKDAEALSKFCGFYNVVVFGGMGHKEQQNALRRPIDILVGTPGRIIDYSQHGHLHLKHTEILILDEADRMLDMGFIPDVKRIIYQLPKKDQRQTMLFSATFSQDILNLVKSWICEPTMIEIESENVVATLIDQQFYAVSQHDKLALLLWILKHEKYSRMLVFGNRKDHNIALVRKLSAHGVKAVVLSGDVPQKKRMSILESFRTGETKLIVSTDVAARGIHVDDISHVINYDLPERADDYVHRIGRTGRAGESGKSISFVCEYGAYVLEELEKTIGNKIETVQPEENMLHLEPAKYRRQRTRRR